MKKFIAVVMLIGLAAFSFSALAGKAPPKVKKVTKTVVKKEVAKDGKDVTTTTKKVTKKVVRKKAAPPVDEE